MSIDRKVDLRKVSNDFTSINMSMYTISGKVSLELAIFGQSGGRIVFEKQMSETIAIVEDILAKLKEMNVERGENIQKMIDAGKSMRNYKP